MACEVTTDAVGRWAASGALALTGPAGRAPLGPPNRLVPRLDAMAAPFPGLDAVALLGERAAIAGLTRRGRVSCGGGCRLLQAADGWIAVSLPRPEDVDAVAAWLQVDDLPPGTVATETLWTRVTDVVRHRSAAEVEERGVLMDLAVGRLGSAPQRPAVVGTRVGPAPPVTDLSGRVVIDLTSLWAGPLCGDLLAAAGADVVKVESTRRPDGARLGPPELFDLLNGRKRSVALDLTTRCGAAVLQALLGRADIVLEASRPRALARLGLDAIALVAAGRPQVWVSITGHGRSGDPDRVAFGDDAAVAGGLVVQDDCGPSFCADAVADPASGLVAAGACVDALAAGGRWLLDVAMAAVAADLAGPTLPVPAGTVPVAPHARPVRRRASRLGADTSAVMAELGITAP